ncbi:hypothetical protein [Leptospira kirschneri]|uniref:Uncharacterized protein n=1 Tax=Leptospira kirschneri serovar Bulgarica str. Nikolaevo TaxID=1240687 RepID=M6F8Y8_9LEPT|nr:hypothetical protein [Leptospira kirschneri]EMK22399.1 hypothetical protein LEP1GSC008_1569 [Leptospira kirschneri serovar Bulgarica str. Nikolaevo]EMK24489.1 hypothetical protein LEP1GSC008_2642 [Leptospira kirschneri serovar Bulgarica str. Nikolaevo]EMK24895.1 hypothetical protein LEP1GSC008_0588 [Leptospira kirschneri serovar Bulgarica str. Nikolaevo]
MEPIFAIKSHRRRISESVQKIMEETNQVPEQILLTRLSILEYFVDDDGLADRFSQWVQKKKISEGGLVNGKRN